MDKRLSGGALGYETVQFVLSITPTWSSKRAFGVCMPNREPINTIPKHTTTTTN